MNREEAKKKAEALVARMTLEEKASQLRYDAPAIKRLGIPAYNWWNEGLHGVARAGQATVVQTVGRHDPCVGIRATPIAEAMLALVLIDHALLALAQPGLAVSTPKLS